MSDSEILHQNIALWSSTAPKEAVRLPYVDTSLLQFCKTEKGEQNLKKGKSLFHAASGALSESMQWFSQLQLNDVDVLYIYGVGLGYAYDAAKEWLAQSNQHHLVFLEDDLAVIHCFFETERASKLLKDPQVQLLYFNQLEEEQSPLTELYWQFMTNQIKVTALPYYAKEKEELFQQLEYKLHYDANLRHAVVDEYLTYGVSFFRNYYPNMLQLAGASLGDGLANAFQGVPAIICGAGPSLNKLVPLLSQLKDRALIFAGGSAINALNAAGLQPHLGAGIDPNPEQFKRLGTQFSFEAPYLYRNRMYVEAFRHIHGPKLYVTGSGGYDIAKWFEDKFDIQGEEVDEGFNVVNFCLDVARLWGCNPIIFVGLDLAYTDLQAYAMGVVDRPSVNVEAILNSSDPDEKPFLRPDVYGKPTYTLWKWVTEAQWIGDFTNDHPELTLINATEGGIGCPNVLNESLSTVAKMYLQSSYDLDGRLHGEIQTHLLTQVTSEGIVQSMNELCASLERCSEHLTTLINESEKLSQRVVETKDVPAVLQSGTAALAEIELADEPGYRYLLEVFNIVYSKKLNYELRASQKNEQLPEWKQLIHKGTLNNKRLSFLHNTAQANITLIKHALTS